MPPLQFYNKKDVFVETSYLLHETVSTLKKIVPSQQENKHV